MATKDMVIQILETPEWALRRVERAYERYERAFTRCTGGAIRYDKERVSGGGGDPDMTLINFVQRSDELDEAKARYEEAKKDAEALISKLSDERLETVLKGRYVSAPALTWTQLATTLGVSERHARRMKCMAIDNLVEMMYADATMTA